MKVYIVVLFVFSITCSCNSLKKSILVLENKGIKEIYTIPETNKDEILVYFEPEFKEIISNIKLPYIKSEIILQYHLLVDVKTKSIVSFNTQKITKGVMTINIGSQIRNEVFEKIKIKTKNVNMFNPFKRNIRNERIMAYIGVGVKIVGDSICVDWPSCE